METFLTIMAVEVELVLRSKEGQPKKELILS